MPNKNLFDLIIKGREANLPGLAQPKNQCLERKYARNYYPNTILHVNPIWHESDEILHRGMSFEPKLNLWKTLSLNFNKSLKQVTAISNQSGKIPLGYENCIDYIILITKIWRTTIEKIFPPISPIESKVKRFIAAS